MIFAIVAAVLAYRRANENGRNGWLWAFVAAGVFIGTQLVISIGAGLLSGLGVAFFGWSEGIWHDNMFVGPVTVVALAGSILATWLLLRYLDKPVASEVGSESPPPPPSFTQDV